MSGLQVRGGGVNRAPPQLQARLPPGGIFCQQRFGGGNGHGLIASILQVKIIHKPMDFSHIAPRVDDDNLNHQPGGGDVKIVDEKLQWKAKPKVDDDNLNHQPGGGDVKIVGEKVTWKAKPKVDDDNLEHVPGGGDVKIVAEKVTWKAKPRVDDDNLDHVPGGGNVRIVDRKLSYTEKAKAKVDHNNLAHVPKGGKVSCACPRVGYDTAHFRRGGWGFFWGGGGVTCHRVPPAVPQSQRPTSSRGCAGRPQSHPRHRKGVSSVRRSGGRAPCQRPNIWELQATRRVSSPNAQHKCPGRRSPTHGLACGPPGSPAGGRPGANRSPDRVPHSAVRCVRVCVQGGGLGPKSLCTRNGPKNFVLKFCFFPIYEFR